MSNMHQHLGDQIATARANWTEAKIAGSTLAKQLQERIARVTSGVDYKALGSNEAERKLRLEELLASDPEVCALRDAVHENNLELMRRESLFNEYCDMRRGEEWSVRLQLAEGLAARRIQAEPDDHAFDDVADEETLGKYLPGYEGRRHKQPATATVEELWGSNEPIGPGPPPWMEEAPFDPHDPAQLAEIPF